MADAKKILIVGAGGIGLKHVRAFNAAGAPVELTAVEPRPEARARAEEMGAKALDCAWESVSLSDFDGVVICAPAPMHITMAKRCLVEGVPVLSEKPLSHAWEGVEELVELARRPGASTSGVAYTRRYVPAHQHLRAMLASGELGQIPVLRMSVGQPFTTYRPDYRQIYYANRQMGGGCTLDFASHFIDLAQFYLGRIASARGYARHLVLEGVSVEDTGAISFEFAGSGALGSLSINQYQPVYENLIDFCGPDACLRLVEPSYETRIWRRGSDGWEDIPLPQGDYIEGLRLQAAAFLAAIDGGPAMSCSIEEAANTLRVCLDIMKTSGID